MLVQITQYLVTEVQEVAGANKVHGVAMGIYRQWVRLPVLGLTLSAHSEVVVVLVVSREEVGGREGAANLDEATRETLIMTNSCLLVR